MYYQVLYLVQKDNLDPVFLLQEFPSTNQTVIHSENGLLLIWTKCFGIIEDELDLLLEKTLPGAWVLINE